MSWSWPQIPTRVTAFDGRAWVETEPFDSEEEAADYARATYPADDIDDGLVGLVPEWDAADPWDER